MCLYMSIPSWISLEHFASAVSKSLVHLYEVSVMLFLTNCLNRKNNNTKNNKSKNCVTNEHYNGPYDEHKLNKRRKLTRAASASSALTTNADNFTVNLTSLAALTHQLTPLSKNSYGITCADLRAIGSTHCHESPVIIDIDDIYYQQYHTHQQQQHPQQLLFYQPEEEEEEELQDNEDSDYESQEFYCYNQNCHHHHHQHYYQYYDEDHHQHHSM